MLLKQKSTSSLAGRWSISPLAWKTDRWRLPSPLPVLPQRGWNKLWAQQEAGHGRGQSCIKLSRTKAHSKGRENTVAAGYPMGYGHALSRVPSWALFQKHHPQDGFSCHGDGAAFGDALLVHLVVTGGSQGPGLQKASLAPW